MYPVVDKETLYAELPPKSLDISLRALINLSPSSLGVKALSLSKVSLNRESSIESSFLSPEAIASNMAWSALMVHSYKFIAAAASFNPDFFISSINPCKTLILSFKITDSLLNKGVSLRISAKALA